MHPLRAAKGEEGINEKKSRPRIGTNYTKEAEACMGGPSAPSDSPSGREELCFSLPLGLSLGQREALPPMLSFVIICDNSWLAFCSQKDPSIPVMARHMSSNH